MLIVSRHKNNPYAEWYFNSMRFPDGPTGKHHKEVYGDAPYDDFLDKWSAKDFNAQNMVNLFSKAGAKYVVPVTKHHVCGCGHGSQSLTPQTGWGHSLGCTWHQR